MSYCRLSLLLLLLLSPTTQATTVEFYIDSLAQPTDADGVWRFRTGDNMAWADPALNHGRWDNLMGPRDWRSQGYADYTGMAWYRATFEFDLAAPGMLADLEELGVSVGKIHSAYELYANGLLLGGVGALPPNAVAQNDKMRLYAIPRNLIGDDGRLTLSLRVWREDALGRVSKSGMYEEPLRVGKFFQLTQQTWIYQVFMLMLAMVYAAFGFYHLYLYARNTRSPDFLWFAVTAILIAIYTLETSQWRFLTDIFSYALHNKIEYFTIYLLPAAGAQLVWSLLRYRPKPWHRAYQMVFVVMALTVAVVPGNDIHTYTLFYWQLLLVPAMLGVLVQILWEATSGNIEARTMLVGWGIFVMAALNDILVVQGVVQHPRMMTLGFAAIMATGALSLANRLTRLLNQLENEVSVHTSELQESNEKLVEATRLDLLTGLLNRRGFAEKLEFEISRSRRSRRGFVVMMADIDHFKAFNDQHGHACGDYVLREIARLLREKLRDVDVISRWAGEEFIFLLPETNLEGGAVLAEKLRAGIERAPLRYESEVNLQLTITMGVIQFHEGMDLDACLARADHALYEGKATGRNRVVVEVAAPSQKLKPARPSQKPGRASQKV
jgi:diguanylate cyclase (GGDEF)-like protein